MGTNDIQYVAPRKSEEIFGYLQEMERQQSELMNIT
jgi:hypothetical protein